AVALPSWASILSKYRADSAARRLAADIARTQAVAYSTSATQTLTLNVTQSSYQITGLSGLDRRSSTYAVDLTAEPYRCKIASASFGGTAQLSFNGYGQPTVVGGSVVVACGSQQRTITVDATGSTSIQ